MDTKENVPREAIALIGRHIEEQVIWEGAVANYGETYPNDDILFYRVKNSTLSGLALNLGHQRIPQDRTYEMQRAEIQEEISNASPPLVLDLHTTDSRRIGEKSSVWFIVPFGQQIPQEVMDFPNLRRIGGTPYWREGDAIGLDLPLKTVSYTVEFDFGGLEVSRKNKRIYKKCVFREVLTPEERKVLRASVFEHPSFKGDIEMARSFIHCLYRAHVKPKV